jgi:hypothetical protein
VLLRCLIAALSIFLPSLTKIYLRIQNGWKLAMGSGEVIERLVSGQSLEHISEALKFDASVVSPAGRVLHAPLFAKICRASWGI